MVVKLVNFHTVLQVEKKIKDHFVELCKEIIERNGQVQQPKEFLDLKYKMMQYDFDEDVHNLCENATEIIFKNYKGDLHFLMKSITYKDDFEKLYTIYKLDGQLTDDIFKMFINFSPNIFEDYGLTGEALVQKIEVFCSQKNSPWRTNKKGSSHLILFLRNFLQMLFFIYVQRFRVLFLFESIVFDG